MFSAHQNLNLISEIMGSTTVVLIFANPGFQALCIVIRKHVDQLPVVDV